MGRARRRVVDLLTSVEGLVRNGGMRKPEWLDAMRQAPPVPAPRRLDGRLKKLEFPQDRLVKIYCTRESLITPDPQTAFEFADEQLSLIEQGMGEDEAYLSLHEKYEKLNRDRFMEKFMAARGKEYVPFEEQEDIFKDWADDESKAIKEAMQLEFEENQRVAEAEAAYNK